MVDGTSIDLVLCAVVRKGNMKGTILFWNNYVLDCHVCTRMVSLFYAQLYARETSKGLPF